jgi:hypothetical protein
VLGVLFNNASLSLCTPHSVMCLHKYFRHNCHTYIHTYSHLNLITISISSFWEQFWRCLLINMCRTRTLLCIYMYVTPYRTHGFVRRNEWIPLCYIRGGLISLWLYKENNKLRDWKNVFPLHIPPWAPLTYDLVVLTSLTHPRQILLVVLQVGK